MTTSYPGAIDSLTNPTPSDPLNSATVPHAAQHANLNDAMEAVQNTLGTNPQGTSATVKDRIVAAEGAIINLNLAVDERVPGESGSNAPSGTLPNGYIWVNTSDNSIKVWNGTTWVDPSNAGGGSTGPTWAVVSGGTVTEYTHPTYGVMEVHTFTANGSLTVTTPGQAEVLLVGTGTGSNNSLAISAGSGRVIHGTFQLPAGAQPIAIGAPKGRQDGAFSNNLVDATTLGTLTTGVSTFGSGAGGSIAAPDNGITLSTSGTAKVYAKGSHDPNAPGSPASLTVASSAGLVIVAVKKP